MPVSPQSINLNNISFQKGRLLGAGTFGKVFEAINVATGEIIAVKQIELRSKRAEETAKAVEQEIRMMEELRHPNIVRLLGFNVSARTMNVIMEFVPGNSLDEVLQTMGPLHESLIRRYTKQMLLALTYCHSRGVLHRDIKGKNILLASNGQIKIADFGSAKVVESVTDKDDPSAGYAYTPLWVAPEVMTGQYNAKVDVWSVGCVVIELCSGKEPWAEHKFESSYAALFFIATQKTIMPQIPASLSPQGHDFIRLCLTRDVDQRPTAAALLSHPFVTEEWVGGVGANAGEKVLEGRGAPMSTPAGSGVIAASIMETESVLEGTGEVAVERAVGEYRPMESKTFSQFTPVGTGMSGAQESGLMDDGLDSQDTTIPAVQFQAAMTCPLP